MRFYPILKPTLYFFLLSFFSHLALNAFAAGPIHIALNWKAEPQFGGFYAAQIRGEFKKQNLDVVLDQGGAGTPTVQMVAAGRADYAVVSGDELLISKDHGAGLVALFAVYQTNPQAIMTHAERNFKSLADVINNDGVLAWQEGLPYASYLKNKYKKFVVKTVPYIGGLGNFLNDKNYSQQCFIFSEPVLAQFKNIKAKTFLIADEGFNPYTTVLVTRRKTWSDNPEQVRAVVRAVRAGWNQYVSDGSVAQTTNIAMNKLNGAMDLATFSASAAAQKNLILPQPNFDIGSMTTARWESLSNQLLELKVISRPAKDITIEGL